MLNKLQRVISSVVKTNQRWDGEGEWKHAPIIPRFGLVGAKQGKLMFLSAYFRDLAVQSLQPPRGVHIA